MTTAEIQRIVAALDDCCELTNYMYGVIDVDIDTYGESLIDCCESINNLLDEIIDILKDWAAEYSAEYTDFICQQEDNENIAFEIEFENYLCMQTDVTTTTTTLVVTTTTTVNPRQVDWSIVFRGYKCMQEFDADAPDEKEGEITSFLGTYDNFLCEQFDDPNVTTTTTTMVTTTTTTQNPAFTTTTTTRDPNLPPLPTPTTTTTSTISPTRVDYSGTFSEFLCQQEESSEENPVGAVTTTTTYPSTVTDYDISFIDYQCMQTDVTTTTTTMVTTTTTTAVTTTTTTMTAVNCSTEISGGYIFPLTREIVLGADTGMVTLTINTIEVPDKFILEFEGAEVINTGYRGLSTYQTLLYESLAVLGASPEIIVGGATGTFQFHKTTSTPTAILKVYAPILESQWSCTVSCVDKDELVTTTTTTSSSSAVGSEYTAEFPDSSFVCVKSGTMDATTTTTTTPLVTTTTTTSDSVPVETITCGETWHSGGQAYPYLYIVIGLGTGVGWVDLSIDTIDIPDKFIVEFNGLEVINTGYRGDTSLQQALNDALAAYGDSPEIVLPLEDNHFRFYKTGSTQNAIVKVFAPIEETQWSFRLRCPDGATTTTTTRPVTTTTTTRAITTTTTRAVTTTTTNAPPVSGTNTLTNTRATCTQPVTLVPANFTFTDANGDSLEYVKIVSYSLSGAGTLKYNGVVVTNNQVIQVFGGATGSFLYSLVYTPDGSLQDAYSDTITYQVRTANNVNYG